MLDKFFLPISNHYRILLKSPGEKYNSFCIQKSGSFLNYLPSFIIQSFRVSDEKFPVFRVIFKLICIYEI